MGWEVKRVNAQGAVGTSALERKETVSYLAQEDGPVVVSSSNLSWMGQDPLVFGTLQKLSKAPIKF